MSPRVKMMFQWAVSVIVIALALSFLAYPAVIVSHMLLDSHLRNQGQSRLVPHWFKAAAPRYSAWADQFMDSQFAANLKHYDVAATEWPMFGSVFWLVAAEDLHVTGQLNARCGKVREAVDKAARVVADPVTGTWVKTKWGDSYLDKENVFYRMLLILGLSSYEKRFWKDAGWAAGFTELPVGSKTSFTDVDTGPVIFEFGSVASAFGVGAARSVGRFDHAAPLTMQAVACSWPTPFGFLFPGMLGKVGADSWSLGEVALLFSMTRPVCVTETVPFKGSAPAVVWILWLVYAGSASILIWLEIRSLLRGRNGVKPQNKK